jgi:hypothetical protein
VRRSDTVGESKTRFLQELKMDIRSELLPSLRLIC